MPVKKLNPYLNFNGTAEKAIKLYESALGAKTETVSRYGDTPGADVPPEAKNRIMHAVLHIGAGTIMVSDSPPGAPPSSGNNVSVVLDFDDVTDMKKKFEALAAGGKVTMPLQDTFWGATFGMLVDAHGVPWMLNCEQRKA